MILSDNEHDMLVQLAGSEGLSASDYLRQMIRRQHREAFGSTTTRNVKKKTPTKVKK